MYNLKVWTIVASFYGFNSTGKSQFLDFKSQLEQNHDAFSKEQSQESKHESDSVRKPLLTTTLSHKPSMNFKSTRLSKTFSTWYMCNSLSTVIKLQMNHFIFLWFISHTRCNETHILLSLSWWLDNCFLRLFITLFLACFLLWDNSVTPKSQEKWLSSQCAGWSQKFCQHYPLSRCLREAILFCPGNLYYAMS